MVTGGAAALAGNPGLDEPGARVLLLFEAYLDTAAAEHPDLVETLQAVCRGCPGSGTTRTSGCGSL